MRLQAGVPEGMPFQRGLIHEIFITFFAFERLFSIVPPLMTREVFLVEERLITFFAFERFHASVALFVILMLTRRLEAFAARRAHERPLSRVEPQVFAEIPVLREGFPAKLTLERLDAVVPFLVLVERRFVGEGLAWRDQIYFLTKFHTNSTEFGNKITKSGHTCHKDRRNNAFHRCETARGS